MKIIICNEYKNIHKSLNKRNDEEKKEDFILVQD